MLSFPGLDTPTAPLAHGEKETLDAGKLARFIDEEMARVKAGVSDLVPEERAINGLRHICLQRLELLRTDVLKSVGAVPAETVFDGEEQIAQLCESIDRRVLEIIEHVQANKPSIGRPGRRNRFSKTDVRVYDQLASLLRREWRRVRERFHEKYQLNPSENGQTGND